MIDTTCSTNSTDTFSIKQNDLLETLQGQIINSVTGIAQDLTGATLKFHMTHRRNKFLKINAVASILGDPTEGRFEYVWQVGDTDTVGVYDGEIEITRAGKPITAPNDSYFTINIVRELA